MTWTCEDPLVQLAARPRVREWLAFVLVSALPTLAVSALAMRALRGEEAAVRREMGLELERAEARAREAWELALAAPPESPAPVADPVTWAPRSQGEVAEGGPCEAHATALRAGEPGHQAPILANCADHRTPSGRFLWPIVALAPGAHTSSDALADWFDRHGDALATTERAAIRTELEAAGWLSSAERARLAVALEGTSGSEARAFASDHISAGTTRDAIDWHDARSLGHLRRRGDGYGGFVIHPRSIERGLAAGWPSLPPGIEARVVFGADRGAVELFPGAAHLVVRWRDPTAVDRATRRSRWLLIGGAVAAGLVALAFAAMLWSRVRAERRLSALRTDFVAAVSHELRTPLSSLRMLAELLEADAIEPEERPEVHAGLAREARRLGETVERLLRFSRMEAGGGGAQTELQPLGPLLRRAANRFAERFPEGQPVDVDDDDLVAPVDGEGLSMALDNLLHNAHKYAPEGGPYRLRARRRRGTIEIEVIDQGPGIRRRDQRRIFRAFERADDRLSEATEGTGIGLSLVQHVARSHGGRLELDSVPGEGACFRLILPLPHDASPS